MISPWNFPLILSLGDAIPALIAGCAVVIKPSEITPLGLAEIVEAWKSEIGGPDVFDVVNGMGETGSALVDEVDFVQFTGSDRTAKKVLARAAETLTPVSAELGGKDPMIVLRSANVERAANAATWGAFANAGQVCISVERLYVEEPVYDEFVRRLHRGGPQAQPGNGRPRARQGRRRDDLPAPDEDRRGPRRGRPRSRSDRPHRRRAPRGRRRLVPADGPHRRRPLDEDHARRDLRPGGRDHEGPRRRRGRAAGQRQPLRARRARSSAAKREAEAVARRLEVGTANVNDVLVGFLASDVPMGGWKDSGIGFRHGEYGIKKFVRPESLVITRFGGKREPLYFPYTEKRRARLAEAHRLLQRARLAPPARPQAAPAAT